MCDPQLNSPDNQRALQAKPQLLQEWAWLRIDGDENSNEECQPDNSDKLGVMFSALLGRVTTESNRAKHNPAWPVEDADKNDLGESFKHVLTNVVGKGRWAALYRAASSNRRERP